jgi:lipoyl(octanoyl) transferase
VRYATRRLWRVVQVRVNRPLLVARLGTMDYQEAWDLQRRLAEARRRDIVPDTLLLLEHPHTYTLGRRSKPEHVLLTRAELNRRQIPLYEVDRGGDVTYHGPGQLVGYPILKRTSARIDYVSYIRDVERALVASVLRLGLPGKRRDGFSGVWVGNDKLCAIGIKIDAYGITSHGFALNVNTDLAFFSHIVPCGISDGGVTSLQREFKRRVSMRRVTDAVVDSMEATFGLDARPRSVGLVRVEQLAAGF